MPKERKSEGFHSAAGLIRYFDSETEKALKVPPWLVIGLAIASAIIITAISYIWPV
ncbi:MAG: preprotein translocase subunit Sec61beta [Thermoplasmata archaeon]